MSKIVTLSKVRPETALDNLNRLTGLDFQQWPESLINAPANLETHQTHSLDHGADAKRPAQLDTVQAMDALLRQQG